MADPKNTGPEATPAKTLARPLSKEQLLQIADATTPKARAAAGSADYADEERNLWESLHIAATRLADLAGKE